MLQFSVVLFSTGGAFFVFKKLVWQRVGFYQSPECHHDALASSHA